MLSGTSVHPKTSKYVEKGMLPPSKNAGMTGCAPTVRTNFFACQQPKGHTWNNVDHRGLVACARE
eukprot:scaffold1911_cov397-Prasinococcus_capsulatus_cf.AAC.8